MCNIDYVESESNSSKLIDDCFDLFSFDYIYMFC